jgi:hypothetical protein
MSSLSERARADAKDRGDDWGERLDLEPGDEWEGRWLGEVTAAPNEWRDREQRVFLLVEADGRRRHIYARSRLERKVDALVPQRGDNVAIFRDADEYGSGGRTIHAYGFALEANDTPIPEPPAGYEEPAEGDIPW